MDTEHSKAALPSSPASYPSLPSPHPLPPPSPLSLPSQSHPEHPQPPPLPPSPSRSLTSLPSHYLSTYTSFVRSNSAEITRFESLLRNLVLFLPSHSSANITTEAAHTLLTLLTTFHTSILAPRKGDPGYKQSLRERYVEWAKGDTAAASSSNEGVGRRTRTWLGLSRGNIYKNALAILRIVQYLQLLLEMLAKRAGNKMRWRVVVLLEGIKATCRFIMLRFTGTRTVTGTSIGAEEQVRKVDDNEDDTLTSPTLLPSSSQQARSQGEGEGWHMPRTHLTLPPLPSFTSTPYSTTNPTSVIDYLESHLPTSTSLKPARALVRRLESLPSQAGEAIWILRPLVYALLLQRVQGNRRDWRPWVAGVGMEVLSYQITKRDVGDRVAGGRRGLSEVENDETSRRKWGMAWWAMRGAFYEGVTGKWVKRLEEGLKGKPVIGMVGAVVEDYGWLWEEYYYSTATE